VSKFQEPKVWLTPSLSEAILDAWRQFTDRLGHLGGRPVPKEWQAEQLYLRACTTARLGNLEQAASEFAAATQLAPTLAEAFEGHGEVLDRMGDSDGAERSYGIARKLRQTARLGAPDRCHVLRHGPPSLRDIAAYTIALQSGESKRGVLLHVARGNAYLANGRAKLALLDYGFARQFSSNPEITALRAEALAVAGRYQRALKAFDAAIAKLPSNGEFHGGRAIARLALGQVADADRDWRRQLELLPPTRAAARACVCLRLADWEAALPELERAIEREPVDLYWRLYRLTSQHRLGRPADTHFAEAPAPAAWPGPLLALHAGELSASNALEQADTAARRAEAMFQIGVLACARDRSEARRWWQQVIDATTPAAIEHAAARHEMARAA
jgi:Flp pilus assembly protein TadD